jgi:NAD(P)-dependent dehydrogenase (short-subunit alcohol dehydrogenase family)
MADFIPGRFDGQVALVVGGAQGIGKAIASRLAREGARLVIADIDRPMLKQTEAEIGKAGGNVRTLYCDVRKKPLVDRTVAQVIRWYQRVDVMMYVSGVSTCVPFLQTDEKVWDQTMAVNLRGGFLMARAVAPHMVKQQSGKLVFMASTNAWDGEAGLAPYNASKSGLFLLAKTLARELGPQGINSNAIGPGLIRTRLTKDFLKIPMFKKKYENLIPAGRIGDPEDIAGPATFLASHDADYVNGVLLFVDGGQLA